MPSGQEKVKVFSKTVAAWTFSIPHFTISDLQHFGMTLIPQFRMKRTKMAVGEVSNTGFHIAPAAQKWLILQGLFITQRRKTNKCNQWDYAFTDTGNLRKHRGEKSNEGCLYLRLLVPKCIILANQKVLGWEDKIQFFSGRFRGQECLLSEYFAGENEMKLVGWEPGNDGATISTKEPSSILWSICLQCFGFF